MLIDLDPQASASSWLMTQDRFLDEIVNNPENPKNTIYQLFRDAIFNENSFNGIQTAVVKNSRLHPLIPNLDLISADAKLDNLEREIVNYDDLKNSILLESLTKLNIIDKYDYILIDCPPNMGTGSKNAIFASDVLLIPIIADPLSFQGFPELINSSLEVVEIAGKRRDDHKKPIFGGLILSHVRKETTSFKKTVRQIRDMLKILKKEQKINQKADIFISQIGYRVAIPNVQGEDSILITSKKRSDSQSEFEALSREFHDKIQRMT